ncbi:hypothetical protein BvCmsKKP036_04939 [Escherichia coli]|nr:hypothetical protein BvCmsKKP036_04939 [Escherichia coli]GDW30113.1 hypothetical protein BvCmsSINP059_04494 [Escherichia coli]
MQFAFALDEVSADLAAFFVALHHRQFFGCIESEVVVLTKNIFTLSSFGKRYDIILIFNEFIVCNS